MVRQAIANANKKSSRRILRIPEGATDEDKTKIYIKEGKKLFAYFCKYYGDPAETAHACVRRHYADIAREQFRNRTLQMERMNSGWRYQYLAKDCAVRSKRFTTVSDLGTTEADFTVTIEIVSSPQSTLHIYISVKNRTNTMGGQDWPKAIHALEDMVANDKNRTGPYLCVFGIAMDRGQRLVKSPFKSPTPYSVNTEVWLSDFFWRFFSNYSYEAIIKIVLDVLLEQDSSGSI